MRRAENYAAAADRGVSAVAHDDASARQAELEGRAFTLADFTRSIMLMETIGRVENDLAQTLRAMAGQDGGEAAARRLRLAEDADRGAQAAAKNSERLQQQARQWAEHAEMQALHQALDHTAAILADLDRAERGLADLLTDLADYSDPDVAVRWRQLAAEASAAAGQARDRARVLHDLTQSDGARTRPEGTPVAGTADDPALPPPSHHQRLGDIDRRLTELRQARSGPVGRDSAQAMAQDQQRTREADRLLHASVAHLQQARQLAEKALRRAATAHDRAAEADDRSARAGIGDVPEHKRMAAAHRAAAEADRQRAREIQSQIVGPQTSA